MPIGLTNLFQDANFIASVAPQTKLNVKTRTYAQSTSAMDWLLRKKNGENAQATAQFVRQTCEAMVEALHQHGDTSFRDLIVQKIKAMQTGILQLARVYEGDRITCDHFHDSTSILELNLHLFVGTPKRRKSV